MELAVFDVHQDHWHNDGELAHATEEIRGQVLFAQTQDKSDRDDVDARLSVEEVAAAVLANVEPGCPLHPWVCNKAIANSRYLLHIYLLI